MASCHPDDVAVVAFCHHDNAAEIGIGAEIGHNSHLLIENVYLLIGTEIWSDDDSNHPDEVGI